MYRCPFDAFPYSITFSDGELCLFGWGFVPFCAPSFKVSLNPLTRGWSSPFWYQLTLGFDIGC